MDLIKETLIIGNKKAGVGRKDHGNEGSLLNSGIDYLEGSGYYGRGRNGGL